MKKKAIEQLAERRLRQIEALEGIMRMRKQRIIELEAEKTAHEEVIKLLEAIIFSSVEEKGKLVIKKEDISDGIKSGYKISLEEDAYVIEKVE